MTADLTPSRAHLFASPETPGRTRSRQETIYQAGASAALPRLPALGQAARGGCVPPILIRCAVNNQCQTPHCCRLFGTNCKKCFFSSRCRFGLGRKENKPPSWGVLLPKQRGDKMGENRPLNTGKKGCRWYAILNRDDCPSSTPRSPST